MSEISDTEVYEQLLKLNGQPNQISVCIEECSELIKELTKVLRGKADRKSIAEEVADVIITLEQIVLLFAVEEEVEFFKKYKIERLAKFYLSEKEGFNEC